MYVYTRVVMYSHADGALSLLFKVLTTYIQSPTSPLPDELQTGTAITCWFLFVVFHVIYDRAIYIYTSTTISGCTSSDLSQKSQATYQMTSTPTSSLSLELLTYKVCL